MISLKDDVRRLVDAQFLKSVEEMRGRGMTDRQIADFLDISSVTKFRSVLAIIKADRHDFVKKTVMEMRKKGYSMGRISTELDIPVSSIQSIVKDSVE